LFLYTKLPKDLSKAIKNRAVKGDKVRRVFSNLLDQEYVFVRTNT